MDERVPVRDLVERCARTASRPGDERGVSIVVGVLPEPDLVVAGDRERLMQLLLNLLDNAAKYAGRGSTATVSVETTDRSVRIGVVDDGVGIPAELGDAVFERFYCVDTARTRQTGGSGLGLPIARWIAEAHGGSLELERHDGRGCRFVVTLPIASSDATSPVAFIGNSSSAR